MIQGMRKDILIALAPILAGLGLAALAHRLDQRMPASVTTGTHGAIPSR